MTTVIIMCAGGRAKMNNNIQFSIKTVLIGFMVLLITCFVMLLTYTYTQLQKMQVANEKVELVSGHVLEAKDMNIAVIQVQQWLTDASATGDEEALDEAAEFAEKFRMHAVNLHENDAENSEYLNDL